MTSEVEEAYRKIRAYKQLTASEADRFLIEKNEHYWRGVDDTFKMVEEVLEDVIRNRS